MAGSRSLTSKPCVLREERPLRLLLCATRMTLHRNSPGNKSQRLYPYLLGSYISAKVCITIPEAGASYGDSAVIRGGEFKIGCRVAATGKKQNAQCLEEIRTDL